MVRLNVPFKFLLSQSQRAIGMNTHSATFWANTIHCCKMFAYNLTFTGTVTNFYTALTLVLQILYCLGSPAHGPPTGFLQLRDEILWDAFFLLQMERDVAKVWRLSKKKELLQTQVDVLMLTHAPNYASEIINTHKHLQKRVHNSTRLIMHVSDRNIM